MEFRHMEMPPWGGGLWKARNSPDSSFACFCEMYIRKYPYVL
jgi:hypothetical protein